MKYELLLAQNILTPIRFVSETHPNLGWAPFEHASSNLLWASFVKTIQGLVGPPPVGFPENTICADSFSIPRFPPGHRRRGARSARRSPAECLPHASTQTVSGRVAGYQKVRVIPKANQKTSRQNKQTKNVLGMPSGIWQNWACLQIRVCSTRLVSLCFYAVPPISSCFYAVLPISNQPTKRFLEKKAPLCYSHKAHKSCTGAPYSGTRTCLWGHIW